MGCGIIYSINFYLLSTSILGLSFLFQQDIYLMKVGRVTKMLFNCISKVVQLVPFPLWVGGLTLLDQQPLSNEPTVVLCLTRLSSSLLPPFPLQPDQTF